jgi:hypothetical protein
MTFAIHNSTADEATLYVKTKTKASTYPLDHNFSALKLTYFDNMGKKHLTRSENLVIINYKQLLFPPMLYRVSQN